MPLNNDVELISSLSDSDRLMKIVISGGSARLNVQHAAGAAFTVIIAANANRTVKINRGFGVLK